MEFPFRLIIKFMGNGNKRIHFDFLCMGERFDSQGICMAMEDDASIYNWLQPVKGAKSGAVVSALIKSVYDFSVVRNWLSDRGSHFKNKVMAAISRALRAHHYFTAPNTPQCNGAVESVCGEVLRYCRALLAEFCVKRNGWRLVPVIVQSVLNKNG